MQKIPPGPGWKTLEEVRRIRERRLQPEEVKSYQLYLSFFLDQECYALSVHDLVEVLPPRKITRVPSVADYILGVMNLRGEVVSVVDLKRFFDLPRDSSPSEPAIVVVEHNRVRTGLLVDGIGDLMALATEDLSEEPLLAGKARRAFFEGAARLDAGLVTIISVEGLLESEGLYSPAG